MHELGVGAGVGELGDVARQQLHREARAGGVGERERDALEVHDARPELLALEGPGRADLEQPLHRADAARGDVHALLDEPLVRERVARADGAEALAVGQLDAFEAHVGWPTGKVCVKGGSSMIATPGPLSTRNNVGPRSLPSSSFASTWTMKKSATSPPVANHFSVSITQPSPCGAPCRPRPGIGAGLGLGDRVALRSARRAGRGAGSARSDPASRGRARSRHSGCTTTRRL